MAQVLSVHVVTQDLRAEETYMQMFDMLEMLELAVSTTFDRIDQRVRSERTRMDSVRTRLHVAQAKVARVGEQSTKATRILSSAKYPAPDVFPAVSPLFESGCPPAPRHSKYGLQDIPHVLLDNYDPSMRLLPRSSAHDLGPAMPLEQEEGLGRLPEELSSISSLLLFNTDEVPYKKYVSLDNLSSKAGDKRRKDGSQDDDLLADAPTTLSSTQQLHNLSLLGYGYQPVMENVPEFTSLPSMLPNLPNVANITWSSSVGELPSIAPSSALSDLPTFDTAPATPAQAAQPSTSTPTPPPPPPPTAAAAPPPPPPPSVPEPQPTSSAVPPPPSGVPDAVMSDSVSGLMADIRRGTKLKRRQKRDEAEKPAPKKTAAAPASSGSGDIFADLITALNRRRKGIGSTKQERDEAEEETIKAPAEDDEEWNEVAPGLA